MDWIDLVKDWGGHILSVLGIVGGLWAYVRHDKKLKLQEKDINELQFRQLKRSEDKELQAEIKACLVPTAKSHRIRFVNSGLSNALNVRVEILTPQEYLTTVFYDKNWGPYAMINPQSYREERFGLCGGHPKELLIKVTWDDAFQNNRTSTLSVPL